MNQVMTVLGPLPADRLGTVMVHEHFTLSYPGAEWDPDYDAGTVDPYREGSQRLAALRSRGVSTVVDPLPMELGRDPALLARLAADSGVNIICGTGMFHSANAFGIPFYWRVRDESSITAMYLNEIRNGIGGTGVRPGVVKAATGNPVSELDVKVVRAAAAAARESGLAVITHCQDSTGAQRQQDILETNGVDLSRCLIGHLDGPISADDVKRVADRGSFVGFDRVGLSRFTSDERRADLIAGLVRDGYADRICISQDKLCCLRAARFPFVPADEHERFAYEHLDHAFDTYLFDVFVGLLAERGVGAGTVARFLGDNCRRLLAGPDVRDNP